MDELDLFPNVVRLRQIIAGISAFLIVAAADTLPLISLILVGGDHSLVMLKPDDPLNTPSAPAPRFSAAPRR